MKNTHQAPQTSKLRTFIPQLRDMRRVKSRVYEGRLGTIGATKRSRYRLVALSAMLSLALLTLAVILHPYLALATGILMVALIAGGWPAATGVAELRGVRRITSHSVIILLSGLAALFSTCFTTETYSLVALPALAAVGVVASFMAELGRGEGAVGRLESSISCVSGVLASVSAAGWLGLSSLYQKSQDQGAILLVALLTALLVAAFGARIISAGPQEGPRRGAVTLGVTPVAFVGVVAYVSATFLTTMVG